MVAVFGQGFDSPQLHKKSGRKLSLFFLCNNMKLNDVEFSDFHYKLSKPYLHHHPFNRPVPRNQRNYHR